MQINLKETYSFFLKRRFLKLVMRTYLLLLCTMAFSFSSISTMSQNENILIEKDMVISVDEVFDLIRKQTNHTFIYHYNMFKNAPLLQLKKGIVKLDVLLKKALSFDDFDVKFKENGTIQLKKIGGKKESLKQQMVSGKVTDIDGVPMSGVTVLIKGSFIGVETDINGEYSIPASKGNELVFSFIGFTSQTIIVGEQQRINVALKEKSINLDEIVLTGYEKIPLEKATGSFQNIQAEALSTKIAQNILNKLEGEFAGIVFDNTDGPTIRGVSTIQGDNDPLIVVDGFPIGQDLSTINPNDIENVTILKDAAAASIWGIKAANGVIVIETKKGKKNQGPQITFSSNLAITPQQDLSDLPYAPTASFLEFEKHQVDNSWVRLPSRFNMGAISKGVETYLLLNNGSLSQSEADVILNQLRATDSRDEFSRLFMADTYWTQNNLAISGGGKYNTYRASITYNRNENQDFFSGNDTNEIIANLNGSFNISEKITFSSAINFNNRKRKQNGLAMSDIDELFQYQKIVDNQGNLIPQPRTFYQPFKEEWVAAGYPYNWDYNLKQEHNNKDNTTNATSLRLQASLKYDILDFLSLQGSYQYEWENIALNSLFNENTYRVRNMVNTYTTIDRNTGELVSAIGKGHIITRSNIQNSSHTGRFLLNLDKGFQNDIHKVTSILGYEIRQVQSVGNLLTRYGYDPQSLTFDNVPFGESLGVTPFGTRILTDPTSFSADEDRFISYFGNVSYTYLNKYTLSASTRLDDANLFGASKKYRNIPLYSIGAKWNLSKEGFFNSKSINNLSLRVTYGSNGNVDTSTSPFLQSGLGANPNTGIPFAYVSTIKNPELRLEKTYVTNIGLDFGLFNNRIAGSIEYYERKSKDLLSQVEVPSMLGFNTTLINVGKMENRGIDVAINAALVRNKDFNFNTTVNCSYNNNEVTEVDVPDETVGVYINGIEPLKNRPLRYLYSYQFAGLDSEGRPQAYDENGNLINFRGEREIDGNIESANITNVDALVYNGTTTPKYYGSWINNIVYKNFFLRSLITFKLGHVFKNTNILNHAEISRQFVKANIHKDFENRWQNPGDEEITQIPSLPLRRTDAGEVGYAQYYPNGNQLVDSASHIRFREIVLGYQFDSGVLQKLGLGNTSISLQANNLGVIDFNRWGMDPENLILPIQPTYTLNFTANF